MAVNVRGVFLVARAVLPSMIAAGRGSIINMSSTIAEIGLANRASYAASKGAVLSLTRQMQADYAAARDPGQRAAARHDPHAVRRPLSGRELRRPGGRPGDRSRSASSRATSGGPRTWPRRRSTSRRTSRGSCSAPGSSSTAGSAARSDAADAAPELRPAAEERLAVISARRSHRRGGPRSATGRGRWPGCSPDRRRDLAAFGGRSKGAWPPHPPRRDPTALRLLPPVRARARSSRSAGTTASMPRRRARRRRPTRSSSRSSPTRSSATARTIVWRAADTRQVDYEAELAVVIGRTARDVPVETAARPRPRVHLPQRRLGARPAVRRRPVGPRQEPRHLLPARARGS